MKRSFLKGIFVLSILWFHSGCSDDRPALKDITVDKTSVSILLGYKEQITALPVPLNAESQTFEWISENPAIVKVSRFGVIEAVEEGTVNVIVKIGSIQKTIPVTVIDPIVIPDPIGSWLFDDPANLTKATIGNDLVTVGEGFVSVEGPSLTNRAARVPLGSHFIATHGINPVEVPGLGRAVIQYTLLFHIKAPDVNQWRSFYQTDVNNVGDAEVFINTSGQIGVGATGYSTERITANTWHRVIVTVNLGVTGVRYYLDGQEIRTSTTTDARFSMQDIVLIFADNDGDDAELDAAEVTMWDVALDIDQVKKLQRISQ